MDRELEQSKLFTYSEVRDIILNKSLDTKEVLFRGVDNFEEYNRLVGKVWGFEAAIRAIEDFIRNDYNTERE